ncbi:adenylate/guanylate cyclase domain-containing protein [Sulfitobacter aestuariivivens]|uniref:Adenylate/guanylate cyclase domain-containing response regulator n=1 Tax=Sulfitobacter aestuariivivens TaxID=2766981 RepID=A0A927D6I3_9RHOB|nr:adenylate/guanylate cyclase domain-containing response regulator [Sulfitobacter aestuariivivens]MBD3666135.1 adenylate/guanylate cyclase domain-containing response regulator [Sulfitobacter aestuariivivens]
MSDSNGNLLIVDDNKVNRLLLSRGVELLGHRAAVAENGKIAMEMLRAGAYDLLLLDIEMPEMDGFEVLEALKNDADLRDIPVIVTSSVEGLDNIVRCIELGADDYIPKPVNKVLLKARVHSCLEKKRLHDEQKRLLRRFTTVEVARDLQDSGFAIGGRRITASVLFCDIRDFTSISENMTPEATIELLNTYYTLMFEAVTSHGGIVSLMVGDGLMALFGAPQPIENSAQSAILAAHEMLNMTAMLNEERAVMEEPELKVGFGIATGKVVAGYAGTDDRATYTCVGKTVNLAARLEAHTKVAGHPILFDQETMEGLLDPDGCTPIPPVQFKGFSEKLQVFGM